MRRLLTNWLGRGTTLLALSLLLGCAPATEKPKTDAEPAKPVTEQPADMGEPAADMPADSEAVDDPTPEQDAVKEEKAEEKAAGPDPLDTSSDDPSVKLGEPNDPVDLK